MASPQIENGYTRIADELLEAAFRFPFNGPQLRVVLAVVRDSYGWKRKETMARGMRGWADFVGMPLGTLHRAVTELKALKVLEVEVTGKMALVKNHGAWGGAPELSLEFNGGHSYKRVPLLEVFQKWNVPKVERNRSRTGTPIKVLKTVKTGLGENHLLPNGTTDSPRHRAELGHEGFNPEDHHDFKRLSFKIQDELTEEWKRAKADAKNKALCRHCRRATRAATSWAFCRGCTVCSECRAVPDGKLQFKMQAGNIVCGECSGQNVKRANTTS